VLNQGGLRDPIRTVRGGGYGFDETFNAKGHLATPAPHGVPEPPDAQRLIRPTPHEIAKSRG
jgi:two-component system phosphate regulon response regulator PhoB